MRIYSQPSAQAEAITKRALSRLILQFLVYKGKAEGGAPPLFLYFLRHSCLEPRHTTFSIMPKHELIRTFR